MVKLYERIESKFEKISEFAIRVLGNSIVFFLVLIIVCVWIIMVMSGDEDNITKIRDCFIAVSFLTFFLIQCALNKHYRAMNVKLNELVRAHDNASNELINVEKKSHKEIDELAKELHNEKE